MFKHLIFIGCLGAAFTVNASWYWPFGDDDSSTNRVPRLSELLEPASTNIDAAADFAAEGKSAEAIASYRRALSELDKLERENPERVNTPEFSTVKTKRAYIDAAIDTIMLDQAQRHAKAVAVSDTTELERKLAAERGLDEVEVGMVEVEKKKESKAKVEVEERKESKSRVEVEERKAKVEVEERIETPRESAMKAIARKDWKMAMQNIDDMLKRNQNSAAALNLKAVVEVGKGDLDVAEMTLRRCLLMNPGDVSTLYNLSRVMLMEGDLQAARTFYKKGRKAGGKRDAALEGALQ